MMTQMHIPPRPEKLTDKFARFDLNIPRLNRARYSLQFQLEA